MTAATKMLDVTTMEAALVDHGSLMSLGAGSAALATAVLRGAAGDVGSCFRSHSLARWA